MWFLVHVILINMSSLQTTLVRSLLFLDMLSDLALAASSIGLAEDSRTTD